MVGLTGAQIAGIVIGLGLLIGRAIYKRSLSGLREDADELGPDYLYANMTVEEARRKVREWEEMTDAERAALPDGHLSEIREIQEDLADHMERWSLQ